jgi:hypothetical protein
MAHIANSLEESAMLWHERLGHLNMASLKELDAMVDGMNLKEVPLHHICEGCVKGKHQRTSFPKDGATRASQLLEIVHTDVCGPMKTTSHGGAQYFLTFIDNFSRKTHVYLLQAKGEVFEKFKQYKALVENEIGHKIKVLRSDNGGEFVSKKFDAFLAECGIQRQTSAPYSSQQNGVAMIKCRDVEFLEHNTSVGNDLEMHPSGRNDTPNVVIWTHLPNVRNTIRF